ASYAWVNANRKLPRAYFDLNVAAMAEYQRLAWQHAPATWYHRDGNLIWFADSAQAKALAERVARLRGWGYAAELLPAASAIADLEPALRSGDTNPASQIAWFPQEAWVDTLAMTNRLVAATRNAGGRVLTGPEREVIGIARNAGRISAITLRGGQSLPVRAVVNAAGAAGAAVAALVGRDLPMQDSPGLIVRATLPDSMDTLTRLNDRDIIAMRPDGPGRVLIALDVDEVAELQGLPYGPLPVDHPLVGRVMALAADAAPGLAVAQPMEAIIAPRPMPADGYPSVGSVPAAPGYYEAITHSGVTLAPLIGRALAAEILGQPADPLFAPYRPDRFAEA
ncbi:MAG: FAD-binding oxidoreductase, partial [Thermomicrobiales bacterium]|nr:FAD-binding oxidoreductase [Thermomicrobiales bacterium]